MDLRVCLSDTVWDIGEMNPGELRTMNPAEVLEVANCGGVVLDFGLKILDSGSYWADHHIVELDRYTLKARFLDTLEVPALFHHVRDLVHSDTLTWATDSIFGDRGFNIDTGEANNLWLQFGAPSASSIYEESQAIMLEIRCRVHLP